MLKPTLLLFFLLCVITSCAIPAATPTATMTATINPLPSATSRPTSSPTPTPIPERYVILDGKVMVWDGERYKEALGTGNEGIEAAERKKIGDRVVFTAESGAPVAISFGNKDLKNVEFTKSGRFFLGVVEGRLMCWDGTNLIDITPAGPSLESLVVSDMGVFVVQDNTVLEWRVGKWRLIGYPGEIEDYWQDPAVIYEKAKRGEDGWAYMDVEVAKILQAAGVNIVEGRVVFELGEEFNHLIIGHYESGHWQLNDFSYQMPQEKLDQLLGEYFVYNEDEWDFIEYQEEAWTGNLGGPDSVMGLKYNKGMISLLVVAGKGDKWLEVVPAKIGMSEKRPVPTKAGSSADTLFDFQEVREAFSWQRVSRFLYIMHLSPKTLNNAYVPGSSWQIAVGGPLDMIKVVTKGNFFQSNNYSEVLDKWQRGELNRIQENQIGLPLEFYWTDGSHIWYWFER